MRLAPDVEKRIRRMAVEWVEIGDCRIACGDALAVLPELAEAPVDAIVTDPPYGLGDKWRGGTRQWPLAANGLGVVWDSTVIPQVAELAMAYRNAIIWGGHLYPLPPRRGWLLWDKKQGGDFTSGHAELAWTTIDQPVRAFRMSQVEAYCNQVDNKVHPAQKPLALMRWCLSFLQDGCTILDPFMGSGTTGVACMQTGRKFIGIEIDPGYFDVARRRLEACHGKGGLFDPDRVEAS